MMIRFNFQLSTFNFQLLYGSHRDGNWEIYRMDLTTGKEERLTNSRGDDIWPTVSPDGRRIAFVSTRDGNPEIYVMQADGTGQTRLTITEADEEDPAWSPIITGGPCAPPSADAPMPPDPAQPLAKPEGCFGYQIAFVSMRDGNEEIYSLSLEDGIERRLTFSSGMDAIPVWSPDGAKILFVSTRDGNPEIYAMAFDGSNPTRLTNNPASDGLDSHVWSPDGMTIAFVSERDGNREIYLMAADGSGLKNLTQNPATDDGPAWSPDGQSLAFISDRSGDFEVYLMRGLPTGRDPDSPFQTSDSLLVRLTRAPGSDLWPAWSPDGQSLAFISDRDGNPEVYVMDGDGSHQRRLTHNTAEEKWVSWIK